MGAKRYKPEEIISKLREAEVLLAEGVSVGEVVRRLGVTQITYYRWRKEYGGMKVHQAKRLKRPRTGKRTTEAPVSRCQTRQSHPKGGCLGKLVGPSRKRQFIEHACPELGGCPLRRHWSEPNGRRAPGLSGSGPALINPSPIGLEPMAP